jgi:hypothetical protein
MSGRSDKLDWVFDLVVLPLVLIAGVFSILKKKP